MHYLKILARWVFKQFFGLAARCHWYWPFVLVLTHVIRERDSGGPTLAPNAFTLLALSPNTFRGDLEALAKSGRARILQVPEHWQTRILFLFYKLGDRRDLETDPAPGTADAISKQRLQRFFEGMLPSLYARFGIDCVISSHMRWVADVDWGIASKNLGVPYVVLYREGLFATSAAMREFMLGKFKFWGNFKGSHLVVHNDLGRQYCIDVGFVEPEKVSSLGSLRMDNYLRKITKHQMKDSDQKCVVLFPPPIQPNFRIGGPFFPLFKKMHVELAHLALRRPDLIIIFKPKAKAHATWRVVIDYVFQDEKIKIDEIPNLYIKPDVDVQELILRSKVVCGINSTTILEAAVAGKAVVVPLFSEIKQLPEYENGIKFFDALQYLDVADNPEHFVRLIEQRLGEHVIPADILAARAAMFGKYVSNPKGGALERYADLLERLITEATDPHLN